MDLYYPEWYKVEKEAKEVIADLSDLKDLTFYLHNPNPYIRRQAILRLNELKLLDSLNILEEILNNPSEDITNKELAGWIIKAISLEHRLDLLISSPIVDKYSGQEKYQDLVNIEIIEPPIMGVFSLNLPPLYSQLDIEEDYLIRDQEVDFQTSFTIGKWYSLWKADFLKKSGLFLKNIPTHLGNFFLKLMHLLWFKFLKKIFYKIIDHFKRFYFHHKQKIQPRIILKSLIFYLLFVLFAPLRLVRKHKKAAFVLLTLSLVFLYYTDNGQEMITAYLPRRDFIKINNEFLGEIKNTATLVGGEIVNVSLLVFKKIKATAAWQTLQEFFLITVRLTKGN